MIIDIFLVYQLIKRLSTPFKKWEAYDKGIIDKHGKILKKRRELKTVQDRKSWSKFDLMALKIKRMIERVPGGATRLSTYAAALWFIKESETFYNDTLIEENVQQKIEDYMKHINENFQLNEDAPTTSVGGGHVDGVGVGPKGEPGVKRKEQKDYTKSNKKRRIKSFKDMVGDDKNA